MTDELKPLEILKGRNAGALHDASPDDDLHHVFARNAFLSAARAIFADEWTGSKEQTAEVLETMREALRTGELRAATHFQSSFYDIQPERWFGPAPQLQGRFKIWKMTTFEGTTDTPRWWFVTRQSLDKFLFRVGAPPTSSSSFQFDLDDWRWRLYDACIWIATGGHETTTATIAADNLDEVGARVLFRKLDELGLRGPAVTGLGLNESRMSVGHTLWERAHTGWLPFGSGHRVDFYFDPEADGQIAADLTLSKQTAPMYRDLRIGRDDLLALFPQRSIEAQATAAKGKSGPLSAQERDAEKQCMKWLVANYMSKPNVKPIAQKSLRELAFAQPGWGAALRGENAFYRAWTKAWQSGPYANWSEGGDNRRG